MSNEQTYRFHGGPLDRQEIPGPDKGMGRTPNYLQPRQDGTLAVLRVDKGDQALGRLARTGKPTALYIQVTKDDGTIHYAWLTSASLLHTPVEN